METCAPCYTSRLGPKFQFPIIADEYKEYVDIPLPEGETMVEVPFAVTKASDTILHHALTIYNPSINTPQAVVPFNVTRIDAFGMTLLLAAPLPNTDYRVRGLISILP
jgi:hypothetical protein